MKTLCIYHGNCADGFGAAWVVRKALGESVEFVPGVYGQEPPDVEGKDVIIVDFSYKYDVLVKMSWKAHSIIILTTTNLQLKTSNRSCHFMPELGSMAAIPTTRYRWDGKAPTN